MGLLVKLANKNVPTKSLQTRVTGTKPWYWSPKDSTRLYRFNKPRGELTDQEITQSLVASTEAELPNAWNNYRDTHTPQPYKLVNGGSAKQRRLQPYYQPPQQSMRLPSLGASRGEVKNYQDLKTYTQNKAMDLLLKGVNAPNIESSRSYGAARQAAINEWNTDREKYEASYRNDVRRRGVHAGKNKVDELFPEPKQPGRLPNHDRTLTDYKGIAASWQDPDGSMRYFTRKVDEQGKPARLEEVALSREDQLEYEKARQNTLKQQGGDTGYVQDQKERQAEIARRDKAFRKQFKNNKAMMDFYDSPETSEEERQWQAKQAEIARMKPRPLRLQNYDPSKVRYRKSWIS